jgi:hypothetical protein
MTHAIITRLNLCQQLIGQTLNTNEHGHAGRHIENILEDLGLPINRGSGPDVLAFGLEIKTRATEAISAQTIADMHLDDILTCEYKNSPIRDKFQQQLRVYTKANVITRAEIYNFAKDFIQYTVEKAYNHAKYQLLSAHEKGRTLTRTRVRGQMAYFENCKPDSPLIYSFRVTKANMARFEHMSVSTFDKLFMDS